MNRNLQRGAIFSGVLLSAGDVMAHAGAGHTHFLADGFVHPVTGWDHALVALVVGLVAAQWSARAWRLPVLFIGGMALGMGAGAMLPVGAWVENGVVLSMLAAGLLLCARMQDAGSALTATAVAVIAFCGAAHGLVHGAEAGLQPVYLVGVLAGTLVIHAAGIVVGRTLSAYPRALRVLGVLTAAAGVGVLVAG